MIGDSNAIHGTDANMANFVKLIPRVILCSFGAPLGDLVKSYAKRRQGLERGEPWWFLDQVDFVFGCLLLSGWFVFGGFADNWIVFTHVLIMLFIITPTITVMANTTSYLTGHKKVPW
jgi:CDP-2,3-bis-(O-geranylgeranyl)-sn-glycerol synthase